MGDLPHRHPMVAGTFGPLSPMAAFRLDELLMAAAAKVRRWDLKVACMNTSTEGATLEVLARMYEEG